MHVYVRMYVCICVCNDIQGGDLDEDKNDEGGAEVLN